jgi:hypothetical protein
MTPEITTDLIIAELRVLPTDDRLDGLYELALAGCAAASGEQVRAVLVELIASLDFTYAEIAEAFHELYAYCLTQTRRGNFDRVAFVIRDLQATLVRTATTTTTEDVTLQHVANA